MNFNDLRNISDSYKTARIIQVACQLKVFDVLASEQRTAAGIAEALSLNERAAELFLNALAGLGFLEKRNGRFSNTEVSQRYLVSSSPKYYGWILRHNGNLWNSWGQLQKTLKTGKPFEGSADDISDDVEWEDFILGMHSIIMARGDVELLSDRLGLESCSNMLDVGGGPATFSIGFCRKYPSLTATVFDLPDALTNTRKVLAKNDDVAGRIKIVEGDFLKGELPKGFDFVFISNIIHMLDEDENLMLMKKAFESLNSGGRVIVKDHILSEDMTQPAAGAVFAVHMLLRTKGRCYSFSEVSGWLERAGFSGVKEIGLSAGTPYETVSATKVD